MLETILNIYLIIENGYVKAFRAKAYSREGNDSEKIQFLKENARKDLGTSYNFEPPIDRSGKFMPYGRFAKLEKQGLHFQLFEEIFSKFDIPENPLICVTPVVDGEFYGE